MTDKTEEQLAKIIELLIEVNKNLEALRREIKSEFSDLSSDVRSII
jgi:hypothetical protein